MHAIEDDIDGGRYADVDRKFVAVEGERLALAQDAGVEHLVALAAVKRGHADEGIVRGGKDEVLGTRGGGCNAGRARQNDSIRADFQGLKSQGLNSMKRRAAR